MAIVGFNFTKINAERKPVTEQNVNIESNAGVSNITELSSIDPKKTLIKFDFNYLCKFEPGLGKIEIAGEVVEIYDKDFATKVLDYWKVEKKIYGEVLQDVFNNILARSNMEAIFISRELGLPSPIQMPRVDLKQVEKKEEKPKEDKVSKSESKKK
jgi:hypothetical protein